MDKINRVLLFFNIFFSLFVISFVLLISTGHLELSTGHAVLDLKNDAKQTYNENSAPSFTISKDIVQELNTAYSSSDKEFAVCLHSHQIIKQEDTHMITSYIIDALQDNVQFFGDDFSTMSYCDDGVLHSHPKGSCTFSTADIYSFKNRIIKGEYFSVLMCGEDTLYYITRNDFSEKQLQIE